MTEGAHGVAPRRVPAGVAVVLRVVAWGAVYYLFGRLGLATTVHHQALTLVAPTTGLGVVWFSTATRRTLPWDIAVLATISVVLSTELGVPWLSVVTGPFITLAQIGVFLGMMRRAAGDLEPFGTSRVAWRLRDLGVFIVAAVVATLLSATLVTLLQAWEGLPTGDMQAFLVRWGRGASTIVAIGSLGLLLVPRVRQLRHAGWAHGSRSVVAAVSDRVVEGVALLLVSGVTYYVCFDAFDRYPLTFFLFVTTAWAGIRFSPIAVSAHAVALGTVAVLFTLSDKGRFADVNDPAIVALLVQLFVMIISATGLSLAISRSELAAAEHLAEERAHLLDAVLFDVDDGVIVVDDEGSHVFANPAGLRMLGLHEEAGVFVVDREFDLHTPDGNPIDSERTPFRRALHGETVTGEEVELRWKDGSPSRSIRVSAQLMAAGGSEPKRVLTSFHDVTADRERQDALASFAGHVAHDLKNPLSVVHAWTETLSDAFEDDGEVTAAVGLPMTAKITNASGRMRDFIQELLDYTLARDRALRPQAVDVAAVAGDVAQLRAMATAGEPPAIRVSGAGTAWADPVLVRIVLDNLVSNAIKYVAPGVPPEVDVVIGQADPDWVSVAVTDNGIGIAPEQQQRIFDSFVRVDEGTYEGTGLGLGICHQIIERHGGAIEAVDSIIGSCLRFTLPGVVAVDQVAPGQLVHD